MHPKFSPQEMDIRDLTEAVKSHLCELGYRPSSLKTYGSLFDRFVEYCHEKKVSNGTPFKRVVISFGTGAESFLGNTTETRISAVQ